MYLQCAAFLPGQRCRLQFSVEDSDLVAMLLRPFCGPALDRLRGRRQEREARCFLNLDLPGLPFCPIDGFIRAILNKSNTA
jgi:hypothetical protein